MIDTQMQLETYKKLFNRNSIRVALGRINSNGDSYGMKPQIIHLA